jgi:hypothetical protein
MSRPSVQLILARTIGVSCCSAFIDRAGEAVHMDRQTADVSPVAKVPIVSSLPPTLHIPYFEDYTVVFCRLDIGMRT